MRDELSSSSWKGVGLRARRARGRGGVGDERVGPPNVAGQLTHRGLNESLNPKCNGSTDPSLPQTAGRAGRSVRAFGGSHADDLLSSTREERSGLVMGRYAREPRNPETQTLNPRNRREP